MNKAIALIDGNNFYASCEQTINPALEGQPIVILSNNDGCIISRNSEARKLNIAMGEPFFKVSQKLESLGVKVFSSNYELYGDMSQRLMSLLKANCEELEIYSIDEAFIKITRPKDNDLTSWSSYLRALIYRNLGLPIAIGIGKNKLQAKIANYLAKTLEEQAGIFDLGLAPNQDKWLESVSIENVWGIGRQLSRWCRMKGVKTALQLRDMPSNELKEKYGVVGMRLQEELKGEVCLPFIETPLSKKETCVSRSLNKPITKKNELNQVLAGHVIRASEKLRKQNQLTGKITIFTRTSFYSHNFYSQEATKCLEVPSNNTNTILRVALSLTEKIYRDNYHLIKVGVIMKNLQSQNNIQLSLHEPFNKEKQHKQEHLMKTIDNLNKRYGYNTITWCVCNINNKLQMRRNKLSQASTTKYREIPTARA
tara:strand:- start:9266 stop:10540 length:1275 start_codon:yes stop_codon:yes gene_type:complete